jgi:hypothetical protein
MFGSSSIEGWLQIQLSSQVKLPLVKKYLILAKQTCFGIYLAVNIHFWLKSKAAKDKGFLTFMLIVSFTVLYKLDLVGWVAKLVARPPGRYSSTLGSNPQTSLKNQIMGDIGKGVPTQSSPPKKYLNKLNIPWKVATMQKT